MTKLWLILNSETFYVVDGQTVFFYEVVRKWNCGQTTSGPVWPGTTPQQSTITQVVKFKIFFKDVCVPALTARE